MKRWITGILAACILLSALALPAFAATCPGTSNDGICSNPHKRPCFDGYDPAGRYCRFLQQDKPGFMDADEDGICDNRAGTDGDGVCERRAECKGKRHRRNQ